MQKLIEIYSKIQLKILLNRHIKHERKIKMICGWNRSIDNSKKNTAKNIDKWINKWINKFMNE